MEGVKNQTENIKIRNKSNLNLSEKYKTFTYSSLICGLSFIFGRISFEGDMSPTGIALCAVLLGRSAVFYPACLFSFLGCISKNGYGTEGHTAALFALVIIGFLFEKRIYKYTDIKKAFLPAVCLVIGGTVQFILGDFDIYIILRYVLECILSFWIAVIFLRVIKITRENI